MLLGGDVMKICGGEGRESPHTSPVWPRESKEGMLGGMSLGPLSIPGQSMGWWEVSKPGFTLRESHSLQKCVALTLLPHSVRDRDSPGEAQPPEYGGTDFATWIQVKETEEEIKTWLLPTSFPKTSSG